MDRPLSHNRSDLKDIARQAMIDRGLWPDFSGDVEKELGAIPGPAAPAAGGAPDLRGLLWCSIDNDDSLDLDQLSVSEALPGGAVRILVAIADVDALVGKGAAIDEHARANTTSVYTAAEIFPMLPERLSTDLTSLAEGQERLAMVIEMTVAADGSVAGSDIYRALVVNRAKLAYRSVAAWLDGTAPPPARLAAVPGMDEQLKIQDRVAQSMRALRHQHGALTLETIEVRAVFEGDAVADLQREEKNRAKELIEDFMIAANTTTATYLDKKGYPSLRRVLKSPERWSRIAALAAGLGEPLPPEANAPALEGFLAHQRDKDPARFPDVSLSVVKLLGRGEYVLQPAGRQTQGHFGLAVKNYTHSTAPNRRFPDLLSQRLLKAALAGGSVPYNDGELLKFAQHCTEQEDNAAKVERQVRKSAAALLLASRIGDRFDGIVTGASPKGTWVRISQPAAEGKLVRGFEGLDVGDRVQVKLVRTDVEHGFIDFAREGK